MDSTQRADVNRLVLNLSAAKRQTQEAEDKSSALGSQLAEAGFDAFGLLGQFASARVDIRMYCRRREEAHRGAEAIGFEQFSAAVIFIAEANERLEAKGVSVDAMLAALRATNIRLSQLAAAHETAGECRDGPEQIFRAKVLDKVVSLRQLLDDTRLALGLCPANAGRPA